jgi:hypothetical protein
MQIKKKIYSLCWALTAFSVSRFYAESVGLLERGISQSQGLYLYTEQHNHRINTHNTDIHAFRGIRTHDLSVRASLSSLRPRGHCDRNNYHPWFHWKQEYKFSFPLPRTVTFTWCGDLFTLIAWRTVLLVASAPGKETEVSQVNAQVKTWSFRLAVRREGHTLTSKKEYDKISSDGWWVFDVGKWLGELIKAINYLLLLGITQFIKITRFNVSKLTSDCLVHLENDLRELKVRNWGKINGSLGNNGHMLKSSQCSQRTVQ